MNSIPSLNVISKYCQAMGNDKSIVNKVLHVVELEHICKHHNLTGHLILIVALKQKL